MGALLLHPPITLTRVDTLKASFEDAEHLARARRGPAPDYPRLWRGGPATLALPSGYSQKKLEPGLARSPVTPLQEQEPVSG